MIIIKDYDPEREEKLKSSRLEDSPNNPKKQADRKIKEFIKTSPKNKDSNIKSKLRVPSDDEEEEARYIEKVKEYLSEYVLIKKEIELYQHEFERTYTCLNKMTASYSGIPGENVSGKPEDKWVDMFSYRDEIIDYITNLLKINKLKLIKIVNTINQLNDPKEKLLLKLRYVSGLKFEHIPPILGIKERQMYKIHKEALSKIKLK